MAISVAIRATAVSGSQPSRAGGSMPEAVIVDAVRTPIGRAIKGSLRDVRADDLAAVPLRALVERNPGVNFRETTDIMMGCGFPDGEQGYNIGRNAVLLVGYRSSCPGGHRQSVLRVLAADDPDGVSRDQGRRGGAVHRGGGGMRVARRGEDVSVDESAYRRHERHAATTSTSRWGSRPRTWPPAARSRVSPRTSGRRSRSSARWRRATAGTSTARSWASTSPRLHDAGGDVVAAHTVTRDDGPRPGTTVEKLAHSSPRSSPMAR